MYTALVGPALFLPEQEGWHGLPSLQEGTLQRALGHSLARSELCAGNTSLSEGVSLPPPSHPALWLLHPVTWGIMGLK